MSRLVFINIPAYGHINPTLGLVDELVKNKEEVIYFSTDEFKESIEAAGGTFKSLGNKFKLPSMKKDGEEAFIMVNLILDSLEDLVDKILYELKDITIDGVVYCSMLLVGKIIATIYNVPQISSFAIFASKDMLIEKNNIIIDYNDPRIKEIINKHSKVSNSIKNKYNITIPSFINMLFNKGDINIAYTSKYMIDDIENYDNSFKFIGPPIYNRKEHIEFPLYKLYNQFVIYISLGTVYNNINFDIYNNFFEAFKNVDAVIVLAAYHIDLSNFQIPDNFIVKDYVPQTDILKYTDVAITHCGMNSASELIYNKIPFVSIPFGADQLYIANRIEKLGGTIYLNKNKVTPKILRGAVEEVLNNPSYLRNLKKIKYSFDNADGYKKGAYEIINLIKKKSEAQN